MYEGSSNPVLLMECDVSRGLLGLIVLLQWAVAGHTVSVNIRADVNVKLLYCLSAVRIVLDVLASIIESSKPSMCRSNLVQYLGCFLLLLSVAHHDPRLTRILAPLVGDLPKSRP